MKNRLFGKYYPICEGSKSLEGMYTMNHNISGGLYICTQIPLSGSNPSVVSSNSSGLWLWRMSNISSPNDPCRTKWQSRGKYCSSASKKVERGPADSWMYWPCPKCNVRATYMMHELTVHNPPMILLLKKVGLIEEKSQGLSLLMEPLHDRSVSYVFDFQPLKVSLSM